MEHREHHANCSFSMQIFRLRIASKYILGYIGEEHPARDFKASAQTALHSASELTSNKAYEQRSQARVLHLHSVCVIYLLGILAGENYVVLILLHKF